MKSELDSLMQARDLDGLLVLGNAEYNPPMTYLTGVEFHHEPHLAQLRKVSGKCPELL